MTTVAENTHGTAIVEVPRAVVMLRPIAEPGQIIAVQEETRAVIQKALTKGRDYGLIPGTGDKPTLLKPGAERIALAFGCVARFSVQSQEIDHDRIVNWVKKQKQWGSRKGQFLGWKEEAGVSLGLYRYVVRCDLVHRGTGEVIGSNLGACSTMESKYIDRPRDMENTVLKMAEKRALVATVLTTFGLSDQFTQDVEEIENPAPPADSDGVSIAADDVAQDAQPTKAPPGKSPRITRESLWPYGKRAGTRIRELDTAYLLWAVSGVSMGTNQLPWVAAAQLELEVRENDHLVAVARSAEQPSGAGA